MSRRASRVDAAMDLGEQGFVDLHERLYKTPLGAWPADIALREVGSLMRESVLGALEPMSVQLFTKALKWTSIQLQMFLFEVRKSLADRNVHAYIKFQCVYGRKPLKGEAEHGKAADGLNNMPVNVDGVQTAGISHEVK